MEVNAHIFNSCMAWCPPVWLRAMAHMATVHRSVFRMLICGDELAAPVLCPAESVPASGRLAPLGGLDDCAYKLGPGSHAMHQGPALVCTVSDMCQTVCSTPLCFLYVDGELVCCWRVKPGVKVNFS